MILQKSCLVIEAAFSVVSYNYNPDYHPGFWVIPGAFNISDFGIG